MYTRNPRETRRFRCRFDPPIKDIVRDGIARGLTDRQILDLVRRYHPGEGTIGTIRSYRSELGRQYLGLTSDRKVRENRRCRTDGSVQRLQAQGEMR
jgi:hypothetical protein